jgi:anti-anti-sigma factor
MSAGAGSEHEFRALTTEAPDGLVTVAVRGEVDIATSSSLGRALDAAIARAPRNLELDLGECTFIDSTGLQVIIRAGAALAESGRWIVLERPREHIVRLFVTAGVDQIEGLRLPEDVPR